LRNDRERIDMAKLTSHIATRGHQLPQNRHEREVLSVAMAAEPTQETQPGKVRLRTIPVAKASPEPDDGKRAQDIEGR
jgi:hypothetical protein